MDLAQAINASSVGLACRVEGERRVIVDMAGFPLKVHFQRWTQTYWIPDEAGGSILYLNGVLKDSLGIYTCGRGDLACLSQIRQALPLVYQTLLLPECDDWQIVEMEQL